MKRELLKYMETIKNKILQDRKPYDIQEQDNRKARKIIVRYDNTEPSL